MDDWPSRLLEECPIASSFLVCHALSSFYFLVSSFVSSQFENISLPNRRHRSAKDKVLISSSQTDGKPFFFPPVKTGSRCALYLTSAWSDTRRTGRAHLCGLQRLFLKLQSEKHRTWHLTSFTRTFTHIWFNSFQNSAGSLSLHQRVIRGKIRNPQPCSVDEWVVTIGWSDFVTQPTNVHQHFIFTNCISDAEKVEYPHFNSYSTSLTHTD